MLGLVAKVATELGRRCEITNNLKGRLRSSARVGVDPYKKKVYVHGEDRDTKPCVRPSTTIIDKRTAGDETSDTQNPETHNQAPRQTASSMAKSLDILLCSVAVHHLLDERGERKPTSLPRYKTP
nr:hypothetical protein Iba_chr05aCG14650 [Ipomoea batatas]